MQTAWSRWFCVLGGSGSQCGVDGQREACCICLTSLQLAFTLSVTVRMYVN